MHALTLPGWEDAAPTAKQAEESGIRAKILKLLLLNASVRVAHWKASTKTNEHGALGDLYGTVDGFADAFIEMEMGRSGSRDFSSVSGTIDVYASNKELIEDLREAACGLLEEAKNKNAEDLINAAAELIGAVNKAAYLLEV